MASMQEQFSEATQAQLVKQFALLDSLSTLAFRGLERFLNLQMAVAKDALSGVQQNTQNIFSKSTGTVSDDGATHQQPPVEKLMAFGHEIAMMSADMHNELMQAWRAAQPGKSNALNVTFDGTPIHLPYFSAFSAQLIVPDEGTHPTTAQTVAFKEVAVSQKKAAKSHSIKSALATSTDVIRAPSSKKSTKTAPSSSTKAPVKTTKKAPVSEKPTAPVVQATSRPTEIKPAFPTVQRRAPVQKSTGKK